MAHYKFDLVQETSTSTGATTMALAGAVTRRRRFGDVLANADTCYVFIEHATAAEWQICLATWNTGHSLTLGAVLASSTGVAVTFSAGTKTISIVAPAAKSIVENNNGDVSIARNATITGSVGLGGAPAAGVNLYVPKTITGSVFSYSSYVAGTVQSDVTSVASGFVTSLATLAAAFTLASLRHFYAVQGTIGAGSTVTAQSGFYVESSLIGGTNNYGFYGFIASGTNRWNLYIAGTANNYMAGSLGIGTTAFASYGIRVAKTITGAVDSFGIGSEGTIQNDVTARADYFVSVAAQVGGMTTAILNHYHAYQGTLAGTVTTQAGYRASSSIIGATNNYGFYGDIPAGTNRWNFYANGTALNRFNGALGLGMTPVNTLDILGSLGRGAPITKTGDFTLAATENWVINNKSGSTCVVTLPAASSWTGREVMFKNTQAQLLNSASSNVVPITGGAAAALILTAVSGRWAKLVSDGTNWIVMQVAG